jgi:ribosome biogenesis GTPase / thiamine phosphate phosphatase
MDSDLSLFRLGWTHERQLQLEALATRAQAPTLCPARVAVQHRGAYGLLGGAVTTGQLAGRLRHDPGGEPWPAVGDWVAVQPAATLGLIHHILPRTSLLERRRPGAHLQQVIAANVDVVFIVSAPARGLNLRRVERYLAAVFASGARPVLVLNKADLAQTDGGELETLASLAPGVVCLATSAASGAGLAELRAELPVGSTGALVGASGVGKSSLLNRLLGDERQSTATVRLIDDKGRHTTTRRELCEVPAAGSLIDTPGMREFALWDAGAGIEQTFADVEGLAAQCHFRDCRHQGEPGCAVAQAVAAGTLGDDRLASFEKLQREERFWERQNDPRSNAASKGRWKVIHKQHRARKRVDPKLRDD